MDTNKILKVILVAGLFTLPFLPLFVANSMFFPFITGKNFAFRVIIEIVFAIWLILVSRQIYNWPRRSLIFLVTTGLIIVTGLATIFGENPARSFWSNFERMDGYITLLHLYFYFIVIASVFNTKRLWSWFLHTSLGAASLISAIGILQVTGFAVVNQGGSRIDATFGNATYMAVYMLFHIFIALFYLLDTRILWRRIGYFALMVVFAFMLYHTATRGAMLGLIGGLLLASLISLFSTSGSARRYAIAGLLGIAMLVGGFIAMRNSSFVAESPVLSRFAQMSIKDSAVDSRVTIWGMSLRATAEHPLLGWGPENFNLVYNKYYEPKLYRQETWFDRSHNVIFDWLVGTGIPGLALYLGLFVASVWLLFKCTKEQILPLQRNIIISLFAGYLFQNIFVFDNIVSYILFFSILAFVHFLSSHELTGKIGDVTRLVGRPITALVTGQYKDFVTPVIVVILAFAVYFLNVKPIMANRLMLQALYPREITQEKYEKFEKVFKMDTFGSVEISEQMLFMLTDIRNTPNLDQNLMLKFLQLGSTQMMEQIKRNPEDIRLQLFMGTFLASFGRPDDALIYFNTALKLSPKKQLIYFSIIRVLIDQGKYDEALTYAKTVYELDPSYEKAIVEYSSALIYTNDFVTADKLLQEHYGTTLVADQRIIQAYAENGKLDRVIAIWEAEVKKNLANGQAYLSLAASYYANHQDAKSIAILRKMVEIDPSKKEAADYYISEIEKGTLPRR